MNLKQTGAIYRYSKWAGEVSAAYGILQGVRQDIRNQTLAVDPEITDRIDELAGIMGPLITLEVLLTKAAECAAEEES